MDNEKKTSTKIQRELELIRKKHGGLLRPSDVVEFARAKDTELHRHFQWDDSRAAGEYRLLQARHLIRVVVHVAPATNESIRTFVSLRSDRTKGNGYRAFAEVMNDKDLTQKLMADARADLAYFAQKYNRLRDVAETRHIFEAIDEFVEPSKKVGGKPQNAPDAKPPLVA